MVTPLFSWAVHSNVPNTVTHGMWVVMGTDLLMAWGSKVAYESYSLQDVIDEWCGDWLSQMRNGYYMC